MERQRKIIRNIIRCNVCGETLESKTVHNFVPCKCFIESNGEKGCACDGGTSYYRRLGANWTDLSSSRPYTDEERDEYNVIVTENNLRYGFKMEYME